MQYLFGMIDINLCPKICVCNLSRKQYLQGLPLTRDSEQAALGTVTSFSRKGSPLRPCDTHLCWRFVAESS